MKNVKKQVKQTKQFTQFYQGTRGFFYGTKTGFICYTLKVVQSITNSGHLPLEVRKRWRIDTSAYPSFVSVKM